MSKDASMDFGGGVSIGETREILGEKTPVPPPPPPPSATPIKREHDSVDDFEHLEHESSPLREDRAEGSWKEEEKMEHERRLPVQQQRPQLVDVARVGDLIDIGKPMEPNSIESNGEDNESRTVPATPPPSADFEKCEAMARSSDPFERKEFTGEFSGTQIDPKLASLAFMETERSFVPANHLDDSILEPERSSTSFPALSVGETAPKVTTSVAEPKVTPPSTATVEKTKEVDETIVGEIRSSVLPVPEKSPSIDFLGDEALPPPLPPAAPSSIPSIPSIPTISSSTVLIEEEKNKSPFDAEEDSSWNVVERPPATSTTLEDHRRVDEVLAKTREEETARFLENASIRESVKKEVPPPPAKETNLESTSKDKGNTALSTQRRRSGAETGDSEFESEPEASPAKKPRTPEEKSSLPVRRPTAPRGRVEDVEIAPKEIFRDMGHGAWFNPERLNPQVAALIYWRDPKKSGIVFGGILGLLLSLAYSSLISVFAYSSILVLTSTISIRIYKTVLQAIQKTSDGHPFKEILDQDLTLPTEKVHEIADVAIAHANAAVSELRRLFLVEDFVDSLKFGVLLWCMTYVGSLFNGMTIVIMGVVALFTLPKVYETNKAQIDENLAVVREKVDEITAKIKAAIPLGKKPEPTKEE